jgi:hypothetical protein
MTIDSHRQRDKSTCPGPEFWQNKWQMAHDEPDLQTASSFKGLLAMNFGLSRGKYQMAVSK